MDNLTECKLLKRPAEGKCIICGKDIPEDKQGIVALNYLSFGDVIICEKHIKYDK